MLTLLALLEAEIASRELRPAAFRRPWFLFVVTVFSPFLPRCEVQLTPGYDIEVVAKSR
jgi:hypothetical protein